MIVFLALFLVSLPLVWAQRSVVLRQGLARIALAFLLVLAVSAAWGLYLGNRRGFVIADLTTWSALALIPAVIAVRPTVREARLAMHVLFGAALALAAATFGLHLLIGLGWVDTNAVSEWLTARSIGGIATVGDGALRIFVRSHVMFIPAFLVGLHESTARPWRQAMPWAVGTALIGIGAAISLTRSIWLGLVLAVVAYAVVVRTDVRVGLRASTLVAACLAAFFGLSTLVYSGPALAEAVAVRLAPGLAAVHESAPPAPGTGTGGSGDDSASPGETPTTTVPPAEESSADAIALRGATLFLTKERVAERPLTGWGLGHNLDSIRSDGRTEYMYWDLLMKLGVGGFAVFILLYGWLPARAVVGSLRGRRVPWEMAVPTVGLLGVALASYYNPYLSSTLGISVLLLALMATVAQPAAEARETP